MQKSECEDLIFREARLADEGSYNEWLSLWTDDAIYWVPCGDREPDPSRTVSLIYDTRSKLQDRIARLASGTALAQDTKPRLSRVVSNFRIEQVGATESRVESNFMIVEARGLSQYVWGGRSVHVLRKHDDQLKIARKTVFLVNADQEMPLLHFLV